MTFPSNLPAVVFWLSAVAIGYAQVGYALLMFLAARVSRREEGLSSSTEQPSVSLIIPAYNEEDVIRKKIENALAIDYPRERLEIVVASDGSTDGTVELAESFADRGVRVLAYRERRGKTDLVNDAIRVSIGEVLCLCDANVMFRSDALARLVARLNSPRVGAVSGDVRLASDESTFSEGESTYYRMERTVQLGESRIGSMMGVDGGMYVLRRNLYQPVPPDTLIDDFVIAMRVIRQGRRVVYEPLAIATENGTPRATHEFRRRVRLTAGAVQALKRGDWPSPFKTPIAFCQFISHKLLRWLGPIWLVLILLSSLMLWNHGLVYQAAVIAQGAFYLLAIIATFSLTIRETRIGGIVFYFAMSHVAMAIGLVKGLFNRQRVTWNRTERTAATTPAEPTTVG